ERMEGGGGDGKWRKGGRQDGGGGRAGEVTRVRQTRRAPSPGGGEGGGEGASDSRYGPLPPHPARKSAPTSPRGARWSKWPRCGPRQRNELNHGRRSVQKSPLAVRHPW